MRFLFLALTFLSLLNADEYGALLFDGNCVTCHFKTTEKSAPSMYEVRERYRNAFADKEEFVEYLSQWVLNPSEETSLMHDAIKKHGLMPQLAYEKDVLREIAAYIYETDFLKEESLK